MHLIRGGGVQPPFLPCPFSQNYVAIQAWLMGLNGWKIFIVLSALKCELLLRCFSQISRMLFGHTHKTRYLVKQIKGNIESIIRQISKLLASAGVLLTKLNASFFYLREHFFKYFGYFLFGQSDISQKNHNVLLVLVLFSNFL